MSILKYYTDSSSGSFTAFDNRLAVSKHLFVESVGISNQKLLHLFLVLVFESSRFVFHIFAV